MKTSIGDLLEREPEAAMLADALASAQAGAGGVVIVEGEAGIGKTRMVELARAQAEAAGMRVLHARAGLLEREFALGVVRRLLEPELTAAGARRRRALLAGAAAGATAALSLEPPASALDEQRVLHGLYWVCSNLAERRGLLIAVDDAHWADAESLRWASYMANRVADVALVLLVAVRPGEPPTDAAALRAIAAASGARRLSLAPLSERASARLVRSLRGPHAAGAFCRACHDVSGGNPFYLRELALETARQGIAPQAAEGERVARLGPGAVSDAALERIARLPPPCAKLAPAIAVLGLDVAVHDAAALAGIGVDEAQRAADELAAAGILQRSRPLNFAHPVLASAIYAQLPPGARSQAHARAATQLSDVQAVASHLLAVGPGRDAWVLERLRTAAADAMRRGAPTTAARFLRRALAETADATLRPQVLLELGRAELVAGAPDALEHLAPAAAHAPDDDVLVEATVLEVRALLFAGRFDAAYARVQDTLARLGADPNPRHALELETVRMQLIGASSRWTEEAHARMPALLDRAERADGAGGAIFIQAATREARAARVQALIERAIGFLAQAADSLDEGHAVSALAFVDRLDAADAVLDALFAGARGRGSVLSYVSALVWRGWVALRRGHVRAAESDERAAAELAARHGLGFVAPWAQAFHAAALLECGVLDDAARVVDGLALSGAGSEALACMVLEARARVRIAQGERKRGIADLREVGRLHASLGIRNPNITHWRSTLAVALGPGSDEARPLVDAELARAREIDCPRAVGVALRARGLLEPAGESIATLRAAADVLRGSPALLEYARTLAELGGALRRDGRRVEARGPLRDALALADRLRADAVVRQAQAELASAGGRPRRRQLEGADALTPTERRVAELAAAGRPNREIAQALFVSRKAVEMHLGHAYRKLGIHTRRDLPAALEA